MPNGETPLPDEFDTAAQTALSEEVVGSEYVDSEKIAAYKAAMEQLSGQATAGAAQVERINPYEGQSLPSREERSDAWADLGGGNRDQRADTDEYRQATSATVQQPFESVHPPEAPQVGFNRRTQQLRHARKRPYELPGKNGRRNGEQFPLDPKRKLPDNVIADVKAQRQKIREQTGH